MAKGPPCQLAGLIRSYGKVPLAFEANMGQTDSRVRFIARGGGMTAFFTDTETVMVLSRSRQTKKSVRPGPPQFAPHEIEQSVVRMKLVGAAQPKRTIGLEKLPGISNYFLGNEPAKWRTNVSHFGRIEYTGVYPGIDLTWYGNQQRLEYDFIAAPGADPKQIQLEFDGVESLAVHAGGDLVLRTALGEIRQQKPRVYQEVDGKQVDVGARYAMVARNRVRFALATYDRTRPLRIDPVVLVYSTYLGGTGTGIGNGTTTGSGYGFGTAVAVDGAGSAYVTGLNYSATFPVQSGYQMTLDGQADAFITKFTAAGDALVYSTYLGGSDHDYGFGIAVDESGSAYATGRTYSADFPTQSAYRTTLQATSGNSNAFITKLTPAGNALVYSTYLGGSGSDWGAGIAVDGAGSAYITGSTYSGNFPVQSPFQAALQGSSSSNAFVTKLAPAGNTLVYSTYLGGGVYGSNDGAGIAVDGAGSAYVTGTTGSPTFPTQSPYQASLNGGENAFVTKLTPAGSALIYSTYLGGSGNDAGAGIAVDSSGSAYVTGLATSTNFPTQSPYQASLNGVENSYIAKLTPAGNALVYSTYLGGSGHDVASGIAVDGSGSAYVTGETTSANFPTENPFQALQGNENVFVTKLAPTGNALVYSTYFGGGEDIGNGIAVDSTGSAYVTGITYSTNYPTRSPYQATLAGGADAFVTKFSAPPQYSLCDIKQAGTITVADVQLIINQALGITAAVNFLAGNSTVSVVDVQIEINAALGLGCAAK